MELGGVGNKRVETSFIQSPGFSEEAFHPVTLGGFPEALSGHGEARPDRRCFACGARNFEADQT